MSNPEPIARTPLPPLDTAAITVPEKVTLEGIEARWDAQWTSDRVYEFDRNRAREAVYAIDTPPPTVSGSLHVGHVFSYTQTDVIARFWRMRGKEVFYPIGWDDNGLPTERRVQNYFGVRCDPSIAFDLEFEPPVRESDSPVSISRPNFVELCNTLTRKDEQVFERLFRTLGLSVDWQLQYNTVGERARKISQCAFLSMLRADQVYRQEAPTLWDIDFQSSVAQAELEDRETAGAYHRLRFRSDLVESVVIETTRPELLAACVALVAHPDDERFRKLFGTRVISPLFKVSVPVLAHPLAEPEKGSGIAMVCTFGDLNDVTWWRELALPTRTIVGRDGRLEPVDFGRPEFPSSDPPAAQLAYKDLAGKTIRQARSKIVELLRESGELVDDPRPITHAVKYYERGDRPLEIVSSRQWYVRTLNITDSLQERGRALAWHPEFMQARYEAWVKGLNGDWNISRQRFFGVPFPVWFRLDGQARPQENDPLLPDDSSLPVDPSVDVPDGYVAAQRNQPNGFCADPDVMDTWATSSLTPEIASRWQEDEELFSLVYPMDLRPQAHEIIRTWLFTTVVRSHLLHNSLPWSNAAISGWILDPDRKKMSKSVGNVIVPDELLAHKGADAVRYWASSARLGADTVFDDRQMQIGRRLAIKILNASKFVLLQLKGTDLVEPRETSALDASMLTMLRELVIKATEAMEAYEYSRSLELTERFFWMFCDDYVELVKNRAYQGRGDANSAHHALATALSVLLRLFAPFMPFVTEEAWSWWHSGSIHRCAWPLAEELTCGGDKDVLPVVAHVLGEVRRAKTHAKQSMRAPCKGVTVRGSSPQLARIDAAREDLVEAGTITKLELFERDGDDDGDEVEVTVELGE